MGSIVERTHVPAIITRRPAAALTTVNITHLKVGQNGRAVGVRAAKVDAGQGGREPLRDNTEHASTTFARAKTREHREMTSVKLNQKSYEHARKLIESGKAVLDERSDWSKHQPSTEDENRFIEAHGFAEYERWHLGVDEEKPEGKKARYKFPYGGFENVHRCAILVAQSRAGQYKYIDIEVAAADLHGMVDALM